MEQHEATESINQVSHFFYVELKIESNELAAFGQNKDCVGNQPESVINLTANLS